MNTITANSIRRWRAFRNRKMLKTEYTALYAFVGVGSHALQNLYPVLDYLGIRLKYVCCKSTDKLNLIEHRFGVIATTSLDMILNDNEVKGIFLCTSPQQHYDLCSRIILSNKYLFVEKPPCRTLQQLETLIEADVHQKVMAGMQKRYSPLIEKLKGQLTKSDVINYTLSYHTGAYPEGEPLTDLFIHPVDLASYLFGNVKEISFQRTDRNGIVTIQALFSHDNTKGIIEMSTGYSWTNPEELLRANTLSGEYRLDQMERLSYYPHPKKIFGIPAEKLGLFATSQRILVNRANFNPLIENNQLYTQGFISEIKAFGDMVEHSGENKSSLPSLRDNYKILDLMKYTAETTRHIKTPVYSLSLV